MIKRLVVLIYLCPCLLDNGVIDNESQIYHCINIFSNSVVYIAGTYVDTGLEIACRSNGLFYN